MDKDTANGWIAEHFSGWLRALAPRVETMACTGAVVAMPVGSDVLQPDGVVSPQALSALADLSMRIACSGHLRAFTPLSATNLDLQFLLPAKGDEIFCTATLVRPGKTLLFARAVLNAEPSGREVATTTATYLRA